MAKKLSPDIEAIYDRCVVDRDDFAWWLEQKRWHIEQLARGELGLTIEQAQLLYVSEDPVLWCRAFLDEPDKPGTPYEYFGYQVPSVRAWDQDTIHQDGAEVGKTREIVGLVLWGECTSFGGAILNPWILVGAPQQTHLDEIIMAIEEHIGVADGQSGEKPFIQHFWRKPKKHPHYMHRFAAPNPLNPQRPSLGRVYYRPAGYDGEAFRGVHVNGLALMDEAAKVKNRTCWTEFYRALKPGCRMRVYSVPDGDNTTDYYRMTQEARENLDPAQTGKRLFRWPKTIMSPPFWSEERKREMIERYGGTDAPGYQRNVLGLHGQAENPVFPWHEIEPNIRDVPEYRCLKIVGDSAQDVLRVSAYAIEMQHNEGRKTPQQKWITDRDDDLGAFKVKDNDARRGAVRALLREFFQPFGPGVYWMGGDLGYSKDPTELMVWREVGRELRRVARIHTRGFGYDLICELIYCLDELLDFQGAWGMDFGNAGTAVVQVLQADERYAAARYEDRMTGFQFAGSVDAIDEDGSVLEEDDKKTGNLVPVRKPAKEMATDLLTTRFQRAALAMPYDPEVIGHYTNHTAREGQKWRIFSKHEDHTIDADRVMILRKAFNEDIGANDVFSSGVHRREVA